MVLFLRLTFPRSLIFIDPESVNGYITQLYVH